MTCSTASINSSSSLNETTSPELNGRLKLTIKSIRFWKNENVQVIIAVAIIVTVLAGVYAAESAGYVAVVPTGSMCVPYNGACDGWTHPFSRTLHVGDILIIVPVNAKALSANYPNSDVIVYNTPTFGRIVHRIVATTTVNEQIAFYTKGDGNGIDKWPTIPSTSEYDPWSPISPNQIVGKVVLRIPWVGHITLFLQGLASGNASKIVVPIIVVLAALLIFIELVLPWLKKQKQLKTDNREEQIAQPSNGQ